MNKIALKNDLDYLLYNTILKSHSKFN